MQRLMAAEVSLTSARSSLLGAAVCVSLLTGCLELDEPMIHPMGPATPTSPLPSPATRGSIAGFVFDKFYQCIIGARVEVLDGTQAGAVVVQTICDVWGYGSDNGYLFNDLPIGTAVTIRVTANGYEPVERRADPANPYSYTSDVILTKAQ